MSPHIWRVTNWRRQTPVKEGRGQVVLLSGEAGIGKSRLVHMLQAQVARAPAAWLTPCQCLAHYQNSTLYPIIEQLAETPARLQQELECQTALGTALMVTRGYAAPEVEQTYSRARELCQQVGEAPQLFSALWGTWFFYIVRAALQQALEVARQLFTLAQRAQDSTRLMVAHRALGVVLIEQGALAQGLEQLRRGLALYHPQQHRALAFVYGQDIGVACQQWSAWALWLLGYPDQALQMTRDTLQMAQEVSHPLTLACAMTFSATFHRFRRETAPAQALAESALRLTTEQVTFSNRRPKCIPHFQIADAPTFSRNR